MSHQQAIELVHLRPQPGAQTRFLSSDADIAIYGGGAGGGKSFALLLEALRNHKVKGYTAAIFRRNMTNITNPDSIWDESRKVYGLTGGYQRYSPHPEWRWRGGGLIRFAHLEHEKTVFNWHGSQLAFIGFDELTEISRAQFMYMLSRNRSSCGVKPYMRATCNPDADSWVAEFIAWWIDQETGYPIPERAGVKRWFCVINDVIEWGDREAELIKRFPDGTPLSVTFIPAKLSDNAILEAKDPSYRRKLNNMPTVEKERLLEGNWKIRPAAGLYFQKSWCRVLDVVPGNVRWVRYWDLAGTEKQDKNDPDYTVGILMGEYVGTKRYVIADRVKFREGPHKTEDFILKTASADTHAVPIGLPQDPGQAGKFQASYLIGQLSGYTATSARESGDKVTRFGPFSSQAKAGNVDLVRGPWLTDFCDCLEGFPQTKHKDDADACSGAFEMLSNNLAMFDLSGLSLDTDTFHRANPWKLGHGGNDRG